jgi:hypothetical protein
MCNLCVENDTNTSVLAFHADELEQVTGGEMPVWQCEGCLVFFTEKVDLLVVDVSINREGIYDEDVSGECPYCRGLCRESRVSQNDYEAILSI